MRKDWDSVFAMPAVEFFNVMSYRNDRDEERKRRMERWKRTH